MKQIGCEKHAKMEQNALLPGNVLGGNKFSVKMDDGAKLEVSNVFSTRLKGAFSTCFWRTHL